MEPSSSSSSSPYPSSASPSSRGRDVLVVEDEMRIRTMHSRALKEMGFNATLVASAEAATRALVQRPFDIMILDLNLPGMDGIAFLESIRREHRGMQVIILTGFGDLPAAQKAIHLDVVEFLTKPCPLGTLERALDRARKRLTGLGEGQTPALPEPAFPFDPAPPPVTAMTTAQPGEDASARSTIDVEESMEAVEQRHILDTLRRNNGNRAATAAKLGISLRKLYYRLGEYQRSGVALPRDANAPRGTDDDGDDTATAADAAEPGG